MEILSNFVVLESDNGHKRGKSYAKGGQKHKIDNKNANNAIKEL